MIKHLNIFPSTLNKDNLHEIQKAFIVYLLAIIPSMDTWNMDVAYQVEKSNILNMTMKDIKLTKSEIDIARIQGEDLEDIKRGRLPNEIKARMRELDDKFGINKTNEQKEVEKLHQRSKTNENVKIIDYLNAKGIVKKDG